MRRRLLILGIALVLGVVLGQAALAQFDDAPKVDSWVYQSFKLVYDAGLIKGYPDGTFRGGRPATRNEVVEFMARLMNYFEQKLVDVQNTAQSAQSTAQSAQSTAQSAQTAAQTTQTTTPPPAQDKTYLTEDQVKALIAEELAKQKPGVTQEELKAQSDELYKAIKDLEKSVTAELDQLKVRVTTLEKRVDAVEQKNKDQDTAITKLQADLQATNKALEETKAQSSQEVAKAEEEAKKAKTLGIVGVILAVIGAVI